MDPELILILVLVTLLVLLIVFIGGIVIGVRLSHPNSLR